MDSTLLGFHGLPVRKSHIKIINSARLYRYKGGKILVREAGGEVNIHKGGGRRTPVSPLDEGSGFMRSVRVRTDSMLFHKSGKVRKSQKKSRNDLKWSGSGQELTFSCMCNFQK